MLTVPAAAAVLFSTVGRFAGGWKWLAPQIGIVMPGFFLAAPVASAAAPVSQRESDDVMAEHRQLRQGTGQIEQAGALPGRGIDGERLMLGIGEDRFDHTGQTGAGTDFDEGADTAGVEISISSTNSTGLASWKARSCRASSATAG